MSTAPDIVTDRLHFEIQASLGPRKFRIRVLGTGFGLNAENGRRWFVPDTPEGIGSAKKVFGGARVHWHKTDAGGFDHVDKRLAQWLGTDHDIGHLTDLEVNDDGLFASLVLDDDVPDFVLTALAEKTVGFSIEAAAERRPAIRDGEPVVDLIHFTHPTDAVATVAIVDQPALRGEVLSIAASVKKESAVSDTATKTKPETGETTTSDPAKGDTATLADEILASAQKKLKDAEDAAARVAEIEASLQRKRIAESVRASIAEHKLPDELAEIAFDLHAVDIRAGKAPEDDALKATCDRLAKVHAATDARVTGLGRQVELGAEGRDRMEVGLEWLVSRHMPDRIAKVYASKFGEGKTISARLGEVGIGHSDRPWSLNRFMTETVGANLSDLHAARYGNRNRARKIHASITTSTFADALENVLNKRMIAYSEDPDFSDWRRIVTVTSATDIRKQERIAKGGYPNLSSVSEGANYQALTTPGDEGHGFTPVKYGGTEDWTEESQINDDVGVLSDITARMGLAAARTLYEDVFDMLTIAGQPTMDYDAVALFNSTSHGNKGTTALNTTSLKARELNFRKRTDLSNSKRLGIRPRFLIVPEDLKETAFDLLKPLANYHGGDTGDREFIRAFNLEIICVRHWTNTTDWFLMSDPAGGGVFEWAFLRGMEEPMLYVQDLPNVGSAFDADKITFKIKRAHNNGSPLRHEYFDGNDVA